MFFDPQRALTFIDRNLIRRQTNRFVGASVTVAELNFKRIAVCKNLYDCTDLPTSKIVFGDISCQGNYIE